MKTLFSMLICYSTCFAWWCA